MSVVKSYQIIRLTVLSTIKLCFPDSKLYLCMCRVIYFCQLLMWKAGHIRFYIWLSYQRIVWFYCGFYVRLSYLLLWILRLTVLSIYQVMLVVIIQHNESCDSTSIYCGFYVWLLPRLKVVSMYVLCYWLSVVNEKAAHTPDSTSDCPSYASWTLLYIHDQILQLSTMLEASWTRSCIVVLLAVMI